MCAERWRNIIIYGCAIVAEHVNPEIARDTGYALDYIGFVPAIINAHANIFGHTGYAIHARNFFTALNRVTPVCLAPKYQIPPLPAGDPLLEMLGRLPAIDLHGVAINLDYPEEMFRFGGRTRIGYTVFETDRLSDAAIHQLRQLDQVWVPSTWGKQVLLANGVPAERVRVVPEGIDPRVFHPDVPPLPEVTARAGFRFLTVGKWEIRKGMIELLQAFDRAFTPTDDVWLIVHCPTTVQGLQHVNVAHAIDTLGLRNRARVMLVTTPLDDATAMAGLYTACHAFVSATKGEGWGLPLTEAMACGLPVIAPWHSAPTEYLTADNSYPVDVTALEDAWCPVFFPRRGEHGRWAVVDVHRLAAQLRDVYEHQTEARAKGLRAAEEMHAHWTWNHAARIAVQHLSAMR